VYPRIGRSTFLPNHIRNEIPSTENFIHQDFQVMGLIVINIDPNGSI